MKDRIHSITQLGCVITAKNYWNSLSTTQKAIAIGIIVAIGSAPIWYFALKGSTMLAASSVTSTGFAMQTVPASAAYIATGVAAGALLTGGTAYVIASKTLASTLEDSFEEVE